MTDTAAAEVTASPLIARALADMRQGRRVLILTLTCAGAVGLLEQAAKHLDTAHGERARYSPAARRITTRGRGLIAFRPYSGPGRGLDLDSVFVDHSELELLVAPCLAASPLPRFEASAYWLPPVGPQLADDETVPARHTVTRAQLNEATNTLGLAGRRVVELHLGVDGGHAITLRCNEAGRPVVVDDSLVHDIVHVDVVENSEQASA